MKKIKVTLFIISISILSGCATKSQQEIVKVNSIPPKKTYVEETKKDPTTIIVEEIDSGDTAEVIDESSISQEERAIIVDGSSQTTTQTAKSNTLDTPISSPRALSYKNDFGGDFGYFDRYGYYYNGCYFHYNRRYRYEDRRDRRGYFSPRVRHLRVCEDYDNGNGYYYPAPSSSTIKHRVAHPERLEERYIGSGSYSGLTYDPKKD